MKKKLHLLDRVRYAYLFVGARNDVIARELSRALSKTEEIFKIFGVSGISHEAPIRINILRALVAWNFGEFDLVYRGCRLVVDQISRELSSQTDNIADSELRYLRGYCKNLIAFADAEGGISSDIDFEDLGQLHLPDYDLDKVSAFTKELFPIDDTTWW